MTGEELIRRAFEIDGTKVQALSGSTLEVQFKGERKATTRRPAMHEHYRVTFETRQKPLPMPGDDSMAGVIVWIPRKKLEEALSTVAREAGELGSDSMVNDGERQEQLPDPR